MGRWPFVHRESTPSLTGRSHVTAQLPQGMPSILMRARYLVGSASMKIRPSTQMQGGRLLAHIMRQKNPAPNVFLKRPSTIFYRSRWTLCRRPAKEWRVVPVGAHPLDYGTTCASSRHR